MNSQLIEKIFEESHPIELTIEKEREFWYKIVLNACLFPSNICPKCGLNFLKINNYNTIQNPLVNRYSSHKCRKIVFLKENTFFSLFPKTPITIILYIHKL